MKSLFLNLLLRSFFSSFFFFLVFASQITIKMSQDLQLLPLKSLTSDSIKAEDVGNLLQGLDLEEIIKAFELTKASYKRTRTKSCVASHIPFKDCIPTMASAEQTELYESQFTAVLRGYLNNQTIGDLLKVYSHSDQRIPIGKMSFLGSFFQKITARNIVSCFP